MSTELQRQVALLKKKDVSAPSIHAGVPSLFLEAREAAKVDMLEVHRAAVRGLEVLSQYDHNFESYLGSIFHDSSVNLQRELKTKAENEVLNSELRDLLAALAFYSALPATHTILEYLIRRYRVHEFNSSELIACMISQHDTKVHAPSDCNYLHTVNIKLVSYL
jgi:U3 small nucleolar RNA-associated protein 10